MGCILYEETTKKKLVHMLRSVGWSLRELPNPVKSRALLKDTAWSLILGYGVHIPATRYSVFERLKRGEGEGAPCDKLA